ncbi:MerR family transcriptional regulator [Paenibacillus sp. 481]|uniref:MerR family transcriptional regulator n=1 Tax=Paenibacillus sp. 481 TaxID=2835869 RepID=UPI001E2F96AC|nr:MerR family transcriptional regulator [Paenibacillus sp. 481]UHA73696.1 MerR family transcriptional regulator [Paenibacillus sp. 481]
MFKISEFSKLSKVSVKALRFYDQMQLLKPAHIDDVTGYRYYAAEQLLELNRILAFKELGFTLQQIVPLLQEQVSLEQIKGMFKVKKAEIQSVLRNEQEKLARLEERLQQLEAEQEINLQHVVLKEVEPQWVASFRSKATIVDIPHLFQQLDSALGKHVSNVQPRLALLHGCAACDEKMEIEVARPLSREINMHAPFTVQCIPHHPLMATIVQRLTHRCEISTASASLAMWIEKNGYVLTAGEPRRELYFFEDEHAMEPFMTEIQLAIEPKA